MLQTIAFQIGTDVIAQPIYHTHYVSEKEYKGIKIVVVKSLNHR